MGLAKKARTIIAANSLYLDAPFKILESEEERDSLQRLCEEDQLHFRLILDETDSLVGIRLAHAHLSWLLLKEWVDTSITSFEKQWARELHKVLELQVQSNNWVLAGDLILQLISSHKMSDGADKKLPDRSEIILELYRLHASFHDTHLPLIILPRWLDLIYKIPGLSLTPDPFQMAVNMLRDESYIHKLHGSIVGWIWMIAKRKSPTSLKPIHEAVEKYFFTFPENEGVGPTLCRLISHNMDDLHLIDWVKRWLSQNCHLMCACYLLGFVNHKKIKNYDFVNQTRQWLQCNWNHPKSYFIIAPLVAATAQNDSSVVDLAKQWLEENQNHPQVYQVIIPLVVSKAREDKEIVETAKNWVKRHWKTDKVQEVLFSLIKTDLHDIPDLIISWLKESKDHPKHNNVLCSLLYNTNQIDKIVSLSEAYLKTSSGIESLRILGALIAHSQGNPIYIDRFQYFIDNLEDREQEKEAKIRLGNALIRYPHGMLTYLQDIRYHFRHKVRSCTCAAHAVKRFPELTEDFFDSLQEAPPRSLAKILETTIGQELESTAIEIVNQTIVKWLNSNFRNFQNDYKSLLKTILHHPFNANQN